MPWTQLCNTPSAAVSSSSLQHQMHVFMHKPPNFMNLRPWFVRIVESFVSPGAACCPIGAAQHGLAQSASVGRLLEPACTCQASLGGYVAAICVRCKNHWTSDEEKRGRIDSGGSGVEGRGHGLSLFSTRDMHVGVLDVSSQLETFCSSSSFAFLCWVSCDCVL